MEANDVTNEQKFIVCGMREDPNQDDDGYSAVAIEVLGIFNNMEDAMLYRDLHVSSDTTLEGVQIVTSTLYEEVPEMDVFLHYSFEDDILYIRSICVNPDTEPMLREEKDLFEAFAYIDDEHHMTQHACEWYKSIHGEYPHVIRQLPPDIDQLTDF